MKDRKISINKTDLISKIHQNKADHVKEYNIAIRLYKGEAYMQLEDLVENLNNDELDDIRLDLVKPVDISEYYDRIIEMFEWELSDVVELTQEEFHEYVQDESPIYTGAKFSNSVYLGTGGNQEAVEYVGKKLR